MLVEFSYINLDWLVFFVMLDSFSVSFKSSFGSQYPLTYSLQVVLSDFSAVMFWCFNPNTSLRVFSSLEFSPVVDFLAVFLAKFSIPVLHFCLDSLKKHRFNHRLISLLHKLTCLVQFLVLKDSNIVIIIIAI